MRPSRFYWTHKFNLVPRVSHLTALGEWGETLVGSGHVLLWQLRTPGRVPCNQAVCRVELCRAATAPAIGAFGVKFLIVSIPTFIKRLDKAVSRFLTLVVMLLPSYPLNIYGSRSYFNCGCRAVQFYSEMIVTDRCFSFEIARSDWQQKT